MHTTAPILSSKKNTSGSRRRSSVLDAILTAFTKDRSEAKEKELKAYDNLQFIDVNREIKSKEKKKR